ncbi:MAG: futalosine hydrolase [Sphingobacteriales bacterium]|nr:MAG: futalosine hydrolase [Sphingobacteriales bacterium]TAF82815.1 MAG: futalosine hydrolase [Sphingobacteriales bacterium]
MNVLLVAATKAELKNVISFFHFKEESSSFTTEGIDVEILITGVGMVATAFALGQKLAAKKYDLAINAGIAGTFTRNLNMGDVVWVKQDIFAELGAEYDSQFLTIDELGLGQAATLPHFNNQNKQISNLLKSLKPVNGVSVNKVSGNFKNIQKIIHRLNPDIETMEGAAFYYACQQSQTPCVQLRGISNFIEKRNTDNWDVRKAVSSVNATLIRFFKSFAK